jgi:protein-L-isoaspartate(D-aspartate) O-methyltransferase
MATKGKAKAKPAKPAKDAKKKAPAKPAAKAKPAPKAQPKAAAKKVKPLGPKPADPKGAFLWTLQSEGISDEVIDAFKSVDPALFFDKKYSSYFYTDKPAPIGYDQYGDTFLNLARMINRLNPVRGQRILEIGTGSGFSTAVLSLLCKEVVTVDIIEELAVEAKERLYGNDFGNIRFFAGDGTDPENDYGKIDGAIIHAACRKRPLSTLEHMKAGGVVVYPMGPAHMQQIAVMANKEDLVRGERFAMKFYEPGNFSLIYGLFGYDTPEGANMFGEESSDEPPKSLDSNPFLFQPPKED